MALKTTSSVTKNFYLKKPSKRKIGQRRCLSVRKLPKSLCLGKSPNRTILCRQQCQMEDAVRCSQIATWALRLQIKTKTNKNKERKFPILLHVSLTCSIESNQINRVPTFHKLKIWKALPSSRTWTFLSIH